MSLDLYRFFAFQTSGRVMNAIHSSTSKGVVEICSLALSEVELVRQEMLCSSHWK